MAGGTLRLARPEILPLSTGHDPDAPLRALAGAAAGLGDGEHAIVQVLARPVTGSRLRRARRAARRQRGGQPARLTARLLDAATPGPGRPPAPARDAPGPRAGRRDPRRHREARQPAVGDPHPLRRRHHRRRRSRPGPGGGRPGAAAAQAQARLRGLAHALASAMALLTGRNWLARRRLRRPAAAIAARRLARGDLLSVAELAAIARLSVGPGAAGPGPRRGAGRPAAARHPAARPRRPAARHLRRRARRARSAWRSPTPGTTCGSAGRPAPARPP